MTADHKTVFMYPTVLSSEHFSATKQATSNILSSDLALETYAQVVNGLPVPTTFEKAQGDIWWHADNPNPEPSKEAYREVELFRNSFNIAQIQVDVKPGSDAFHLRLLELVAVICHAIAALLFNSRQGGLRKPIMDKMFSGSFYSKVARSPYMPYFTLLSHHCYHDDNIYPLRSADVVGYWTEDRLFGGVVLFGRGSSGDECNGVFLNPTCAVDIFQLADTQLQSLLAFLRQEAPHPNAATSILPFQAEEGTLRVHIREASFRNVYRDQNDRRSLEMEEYPRCVRHVTPAESVYWEEAYANIVNPSTTRGSDLSR